MKNEFVPYEQALALKELGFDEECLGVWDNQTKELFLNDTREISVKEIPTIFILAPLYQQAFSYIVNVLIKSKKFKCHSLQIKRDYSLSKYTKESNWCEVEIAYGREDCLKKLIELCKKS